jgi:AraC-binding-like domain
MSSLGLPLAAHCQFASNDFDAMHAKLSSVLKPHDLRRLSNTPVSGLICRARLKRISLNVLRIGPAVDVAPGALEDFFLVQIPIRGAVDLTLGDERIRCERSTAVVISPGQRLQLRWSDNCTQLIVQIPREALQGCLARRLGIDAKIALKFQAGFNLDSAAGREWRALLDFIVRSVDGGGPCSRDPIGGDLEDLLLSALWSRNPTIMPARCSVPAIPRRSMFCARNVRCARRWDGRSPLRIWPAQPVSANEPCTPASAAFAPPPRWRG